MKKLQLEDTIASLKKLRNQHNNELDASVQAEFDDVIVQLESLLYSTEGKIVLDEKLKYQIWSLIFQGANLVTNLAELINSSLK